MALHTRSTRTVLSSTALAAALALSLPVAAEAATYSAYGGSAYGSSVKVGSTITSDRSSYAPMCTTAPGFVRENKAAKITRVGVGSIGAATTKVASHKTSTGISSEATTRTAATSLLGGLVSASSLTSRATVSRTSKGYTTSGSTVIADLKIAGRSITAKPAKNTTVTIPGVATVLLNQQTTTGSSGSHVLNVTAMRVVLLKDNPLGLPTGTVVIGAANAALQNPTHNRPWGAAAGTEVRLGSAVRSGPSAAVYLPCGGSNGRLRTNTLAGLDLGSALKVGALSTTAKSTDTATSTVASTSAKTGRVSLLGGVVTLDAVNAEATTTRKGRAVSSSSSGTSVVGLRINGVKRTLSTAENTRVTISGVGTLHLRKVTRSTNGLQVHAVQLQLTREHSGLAAGTVINVGSANAGVAYH